MPMRTPFGPNPERGVYRTRDGGKTWQQVLKKDENTGASDVALDPSNSNVVFAGLWQARRRPWQMTSGGPGSGLWVSRDGGDTWKQLEEDGLPEGIWGKVGVAVAPSDGRRSTRCLGPLGPEHRLRRRVPGVSLPLRPLRPPHGRGARRERLAGQPVGVRRRGHALPLPVDGPHRRVAPRSQGGLPRSQRDLPHGGRRPDVDEDQPRPDEERQVQAAVVRRSHHGGQRGRRDLLHGVRDRRVAREG